MRHIIKILIIALLGSVWQATAEITPVWSTGVAVPGEQVLLYLVDTEVGEDLFSVKEQPHVRYAGLQVLQSKAGANPLDPNRAMVQILPILVRPDKVGNLQISDISVEYRSGRKQKVKIPPLPVCSTAEIKWYNSPVPYGALWYTYPKDAYVHQPVHTALKIFIPQDCFISNLPQLHSVGVKISTLHSAVQGVIAIVQAQLMENPTAFARSRDWRTVDFSGELTPFREGNSDITGKILLARQRGIFTVGQEEIPLPSLTLSALPLPPGAPAHFADTVGKYSVTARSDASSLAMNEAVEVQITVRGTGNLQQLECPIPDDLDNWKLVPATRKPIVSVSGETVGMVFSQLMRPIAEVNGIPAFSLTYFDPTSMAYKRAVSPPIPLPWRESDATSNALVQAVSAPPPAGSVPVAELTDIYGFIPLNQTNRHMIVLPRILWYLLYLPALGIFAYLGWKYATKLLAGKTAVRAKERELHSIAHETDALPFLKRVGAFIETHIPPDARDEALQEILQRRDNEAFRPEAAPHLSEKERSSMLQTVRKALEKGTGKVILLMLALLPLSSGNDGSPQELYNGRQYSKALDQLEQMAKEGVPDGANADIILYNIGECQYRLGKPGVAALFYTRALILNPSFREARANLDFIQRKEGAVLRIRSEADHLFTLLSCGQLWVATIICTALLALCIALHLLWRKRIAWLSTLTVLFSVLSFLCIMDWVYYGTRDSADFTALPPSDLAVILHTTPLRTAADPDASAVMQLTASSPVHLLARRGAFSYVETATAVRGWVESEAVEAVDPSSPPRLPISIRFR